MATTLRDAARVAAQEIAAEIAIDPRAAAAVMAVVIERHMHEVFAQALQVAAQWAVLERTIDAQLAADNLARELLAVMGGP